MDAAPRTGMVVPVVQRSQTVVQTVFCKQFAVPVGYLYAASQDKICEKVENTNSPGFCVVIIRYLSYIQRISIIYLRRNRIESCENDFDNLDEN